MLGQHIEYFIKLDFTVGKRDPRKTSLTNREAHQWCTEIRRKAVYQISVVKQGALCLLIVAALKIAELKKVVIQKTSAKGRLQKKDD